MDKDYKKLYEESIERARDLHDNHAFGKPFIYETCEYIFPELRESEDEKIKKALIKNFTNQHSSNFPTTDGFTREQILAWLEKQGEQNPADKVESKFNVGDWITNGEYTWKVTDIKPLDYILQSQNGVVVYDTISYINEHFHLWTIQDAKDGDVLCSEQIILLFEKWECNDWNFVIAYAGIDVSGKLQITNEHWLISNAAHPATKEQRDLLFQKLKTDGYEWDAEKKELKKIEQEEDAELTDFESALFSAFSDAWQEYLSGKEVDAAKWTREHSSELLEVAREQNYDWSEEDEMMLNDIIRALKSTEYLIFTCDCQGKTQIASRINWLKTLKDKVQPQSQWKPSEQNIKDLEWCADLVKDKMGVGFHRLQVFIDELKNFES